MSSDEIIDHNEPDPSNLGKELVESMSNWQRSQWARAGYLGLSRSNYDAAKIRPFTVRTK
jgi:hypothetical protein